MILTKTDANYIFDYFKENVTHYIKYENLIYLRTKIGDKYDPFNFEDSLSGIVKFDD